MKKIETIHKKLDELIVKDSEFETFGSNEPWSGHQYELLPVLTKPGVEKFEKNLNIKLPDEYRQYITNIANGGAGPCYGLYDLNTGISHQAWNFDEKDQIPGVFFGPFPFSNKEVEAKIDSSTTIIDDSIQVFEKKEPVPGLLFLAEYGCGGYYVIVVNGEQYGFVWFYHSDGYLSPCHINGRQLSFFDWYENWLDESLKALEKN